MGSDRDSGWTRRQWGVSTVPSRRTLRNSCSSMLWSVAYGSAKIAHMAERGGFAMPGDMI